MSMQTCQLDRLKGKSDPISKLEKQKVREYYLANCNGMYPTQFYNHYKENNIGTRACSWILKVLEGIAPVKVKRATPEEKHEFAKLFKKYRNDMKYPQFYDVYVKEHGGTRGPDWGKAVLQKKGLWEKPSSY